MSGPQRFPDQCNPEASFELPYHELVHLAQHNSTLFHSLPGFSKGTVVVLYFDSHYDNIVWFWSAVLAGAIPAPCSAISKIPEPREKQIVHLKRLLRDPVFLTKGELLNEFERPGDVNVVAVEELQRQTGKTGAVESVNGSTVNGPTVNGSTINGSSPETDDPAVLMLTSGSTGNSKAVCLSHTQIIAAVSGKASVRVLPDNCSFLNWVGFDHVASLVEIHLQAMYLRAPQIHVSATDIISKLDMFLHLISKHRIGQTFAPNFYLAKLCQMLENTGNSGDDLKDLDLSGLQYLATGGEPNTVDMCAALAKLLARYNAPRNAIVPGFGMTETCAGAIFNTNFPEYDLENGYELASLGTCMPGIQMRVSVASANGMREPALMNQVGELELSGSVTFKGYFNSPEDTTNAFTSDGWFKTGDQALLDQAGNLRLVGRSKEVIIINGVKYSPRAIEAAVQESQIEGIDSSCLVCFPYRRNGAQTEHICVAYAPTYATDNLRNRYNTNNAIRKAVMLETGVSPSILPLNTTVMQKSTLGKLSRAQIRSGFERRDYRAFEEENTQAENAYRSEILVPPESTTEQILVDQLSTVLELDHAEIGVETPIYELGVNSVTLLRLKHEIESAIPEASISITTLIKYPTVRSLAAAISLPSNPVPNSSEVAAYDPVVTLRSHGPKTPLWMFHPGVGEVLVFFHLAAYITDRPVYALRARGFENNLPYFGSIDEAVSCYHAAIKRTQATGPYALVGYSYGAMLAFETAKRLEAQGDTVQFLGSFNLPPHIKTRMQQLIWTECLVHLAYFLGLISEDDSRDVSAHISPLSRSEAVNYIFSVANPIRLKELSLTRPALENWASLAFGLQGMAREYEPTGSVSSIDIFSAVPLAIVAADKKSWVEQHLSRWKEFSRTEPKIHDVDGSHYTMISQEYVFGFQKTFRKALKARGI